MDEQMIENKPIRHLHIDADRVVNVKDRTTNRRAGTHIGIGIAGIGKGGCNSGRILEIDQIQRSWKSKAEFGRQYENQK